MLSNIKIRTLIISANKSPEEKALVQAGFDKSGGLGIASVEAAQAATKDGQWDAAETTLIKTINPTYRASAAAADKPTAHLKARGVADDAAVGSRLSMGRYLLAGALCIAVVATLVAGIALINGITVPLAQAVRVARKVAHGDLSTPIRVDSTNELGTRSARCTT